MFPCSFGTYPLAAIDGDEPLGGEGEVVQIDETWIGGKAVGKGRAHTGNKTPVMAFKRR